METLLVILYSCVPIVSLSSYIPQIRALYHANYEQTKSMSIASWAIWTGNSVITALYAIFKLHDPLAIFANMVCLVCCATVLSMLLLKKHRLSLKAAPNAVIAAG